MISKKKVGLSLLSLRLSVFLVMLMWTLDKFINAEHAAKVFEKFYLIGGLSQGIIYTIGSFQLILIGCFLVGYRKKYSYGIVFLTHLVSTISSYMKYLDPYTGTNLLFFAAWPMLAACWVLYLLRDHDQIMTVEIFSR